MYIFFPPFDMFFFLLLWHCWLMWLIWRIASLRRRNSGDVKRACAKRRTTSQRLGSWPRVVSAAATSSSCDRRAPLFGRYDEALSNLKCSIVLLYLSLCFALSPFNIQISRCLTLIADSEWCECDWLPICWMCHSQVGLTLKQVIDVHL